MLAFLEPHQDHNGQFPPSRLKKDRWECTIKMQGALRTRARRASGSAVQKGPLSDEPEIGLEVMLGGKHIYAFN